MPDYDVNDSNQPIVIVPSGRTFYIGYQFQTKYPPLECSLDVFDADTGEQWVKANSVNLSTGQPTLAGRGFWSQVVTRQKRFIIKAAVKPGPGGPLTFSAKGFLPAKVQRITNNGTNGDIDFAYGDSNQLTTVQVNWTVT